MLLELIAGNMRPYKGEKAHFFRNEPLNVRELSLTLSRLSKQIKK